jgi:Streptomyces sporulation and cell division protein, SsgA
MNTPQQTVSAAIDLRLLVTAGPALPLRADIDYSPDDPYAVRVAFHTGSDDVVQWTFARSLLTEGVTHPVGDGDVQVWPSNSRGVSSVCLSLSSPSGRALFEAPRADVTTFLARTYSCVPTGKESEFVDLDAELALLLWSEPED